MKLFVGIIALLILVGCQPKAVKESVKPTPPQIHKAESAVITVESENVRLSPNGKAIGRLFRGDSLNIIGRQANWLLFTNDFFDTAYVWAPSAGLSYINLYDPMEYFDTTGSEFYPLSYFQNLLGSQGQKRSILSSESEFFFHDIGLGSHEEIVVEVVEQDIDTVKHGITFYVQEPEKYIFKVKVDFFKPIQGLENALEKCNLPSTEPSAETGGHIIWNPGIIFPELEIDLERREWESDWFSGIWLRKEE